MKTYRIFGITLVTGTDAEIKKLELLAAGTHHISRNPPKGVKRPRKAKTPEQTHEMLAKVQGVSGGVQTAAGQALWASEETKAEEDSHVSD